MDRLFRRRPKTLSARVGHSLRRRRRRRRVTLAVGRHLPGHQQELFKGEPAVQVLLGVGQQAPSEGRPKLCLNFRRLENDPPEADV